MDSDSFNGYLNYDDKASRSTPHLPSLLVPAVGTGQVKVSGYRYCLRSRLALD